MRTRIVGGEHAVARRAEIDTEPPIEGRARAAAGPQFARLASIEFRARVAIDVGPLGADDIIARTDVVIGRGAVPDTAGFQVVEKTVERRPSGGRCVRADGRVEASIFDPLAVQNQRVFPGRPFDLQPDVTLVACGAGRRGIACGVVVGEILSVRDFGLFVARGGGKGTELPLKCSHGKLNMVFVRIPDLHINRFFAFLAEFKFQILTLLDRATRAVVAAAVVPWPRDENQARNAGRADFGHPLRDDDVGQHVG